MYNVYLSMRHTPLSMYYAGWLEKCLGVRVYKGFDRPRDGKFPDDLARKIQECRNFIVILTPETFGHADDNTSWMAYEVETAIKENANIIPVLTHDFIWPNNLPDRVAKLPHFSGIRISAIHSPMSSMAFSLFSPTKLEIRSRLLVANKGEYDVFISFKSEDAQMAETIYNYCKSRMKVPFWSKRTLPEMSQSEYEDAIYNALRKAKHFVVVLSDLDYLESNWVQREMKAFDRAITEGRKPNGNFIFVVTDSVYDEIIRCNKMCLDERYCGYQILKMSEYENSLIHYLN